ncbi:DUF5996 family protein [Myxococcus sp. RHSTA-1-4]|uniref:DUF5996 family protein n=1 Tax=Myxococcus sp. RHSTA-1-4 TaxID=2874601 RepID=UPI001CBBFA9E|nr:DUF5996 family protein [Myxococcus sp. RHSTA-1-4]MBZ4421989.1 DUF5996 family protein [Myxococcus sp. RHSTA-1-4]
MAFASTPDVDTLKEAWPELPLEAWRDSYATLHRYTQILGKVKLALTPTENHWWNVAFRVTARGLTTGLIPYGNGGFEVDFDFLAHELLFRTSQGDTRVLGLESRPVAEFYRDVMATLRSLGVEVRIWDTPVEIPDDTTRFSEDRHHATYQPEYVQRWWRALLQSSLVLEEFRARFTGKCSPVHFFWGSFDLAVTRFSGRSAPERPGADLITREAYCEEVCSAGFWPGTPEAKGAAYYCYAAPEPEGFPAASVRPGGARYDSGFKEYLLAYDEVRRSGDPRSSLLDFLQSTYEACADLGGWDRARLERPLYLPEHAAASRAPEGATLPEQPAH